ncbi:hypothetical protein PsorP6_011620 [Peronosclerospora sorghi]|uniref:Uncharacterized protein n=1 Tax=Peronosclerospora sorghi TaxID=230839 RepID=A0ACC0WKT0_9STRA|nr:hypothetical protein PsorP6_011620 [Peronosclerospora sorghi]
MLFEDFEQRWGENKQDSPNLDEALDPRTKPYVRNDSPACLLIEQREMDLLQKDMPSLAGEERSNDADQEKEGVAKKWEAA